MPSHVPEQSVTFFDVIVIVNDFAFMTAKYKYPTSGPCAKLCLQIKNERKAFVALSAASNTHKVVEITTCM